MKKPKIDNFHYHELLDRSNLICEMIEDYLIQHPVTKLNPPINKKINEGLNSLWEAYQMIGQINIK